MSDTSSSGDFPDSDDSSWEDDVLDLYEGGEPLWSRWILCHAHFQIERNVKTFVMYPLAGKKIKSINRRAEEREDHWRAEMVFLGYRYQLFLHAVSPVIGPWPLKNASYCIRQVKVPRDIYDAAPDRTKITGRLQKLRAWWPHPKRKILENALKRQNLPPTINKMVCFGVGAGVDSRSADWTEHEGAATIHMTIQGQLPRPVRLLSHYINDTEPPPDTLTFLEKMGFETVGRDGVGGFLEVDRNTVVFSVNPHQPVKQVLAELTRPAVIITHTFRRSDLEWSPPIKDIGDFHGNGSIKFYDRSDPDTPRTKDLFDDYHEIRLWPEVISHLAKNTAPWTMYAMSMYVRKDSVTLTGFENRGHNLDTMEGLYD